MSRAESGLLLKPIDLPNFGYAVALLIKGGSLVPQGIKLGAWWPFVSGAVIAFRAAVPATLFYGYVAAFLFLNVAWALQFMMTHRRMDNYPEGLTSSQFLIGSAAGICVAALAVYFVVLQIQSPLIETPSWYALVKILWIILL